MSDKEETITYTFNALKFDREMQAMFEALACIRAARHPDVYNGDIDAARTQVFHDLVCDAYEEDFDDKLINSINRSLREAEQQGGEINIHEVIQPSIQPYLKPFDLKQWHKDTYGPK